MTADGPDGPRHLPLPRNSSTQPPLTIDTRVAPLVGGFRRHPYVQVADGGLGKSPHDGAGAIRHFYEFNKVIRFEIITSSYLVGGCSLTLFSQRRELVTARRQG